MVLINFSLNCAQPGHGFVCFRLFHIQPFHQPPVLLRRELPRFLPGPRPLKTSALQPLIEQHESVPLPVQPFDPVPPPPAEQEQRVLKWIQAELTLHHPGQPVYPPPQVCVSAGHVDRAAALEIVQHDLNACMIARIVSVSAPVWMSTSTSPLWILAAVSPLAGLIGTSAKHTSFSADTA